MIGGSGNILYLTSVMTIRSFAPSTGAISTVSTLPPQHSLTTVDRLRPRVRIRSRVLGVPVDAVRSTQVVTFSSSV